MNDKTYIKYDKVTSRGVSYVRPEIVAKRNNPIVLDFLCLFFTRIFCTYTKHKKHKKHKSATKQKYKTQVS